MNIDEIELCRLDLMVLLVFINLMWLWKVFDVVEYMGLIQFLISYLIKCLCEIFGDLFFLCMFKGMELIVVVFGLELRICSVVEILLQVISVFVIFDLVLFIEILCLGVFDNEMIMFVLCFFQVVCLDVLGMCVSIFFLGC